MLLLYCRPGFEKECAAEIQQRASEREIFGFARTKENTGYVLFECFDEEDVDVLAKKQALKDLVFSRQIVAITHQLTNLPQDDRITPILDAVEEYTLCGDVVVEYPDTNKGKELSKFCRKFTVPLRNALRKKEVLTNQENTNRPVIHLFFKDGQTVFVGYSYTYNRSPFFNGVPRLKQQADAPSRSGLKLEEAFHVFVPKEEWDDRVTSGMKAVDLGACPGGWTHQLVRRGMFVSAVDNGQMDQKLMDSGQVKHFAEDGFKFEPVRKNIYWLVCDMVEKPMRVTHLMADWFAREWCQEAIFNWKLPMKKRFECVENNMAKLTELLSSVGGRYEVHAKQLYHDREEVTVHIRRL